jgi:hypothetical protein
MAVGIGRLELEASSKVVRSSQGDAVVVRVADVLCLCNNPESRV